MPYILIVCTANICRSPVAEAILRRRLEENGYKDWQVRSSGTWALPGQGASEYSIQLMAEKGFNIASHASSAVSKNDVFQSDLILCMEAGQAEALRAEFPDQAFKIFLLTEMSGERYNVNDPYGGPRVAYERMIREIGDLIDEGLSRIVELAQANEERQQPKEEPER